MNKKQQLLRCRRSLGFSGCWSGRCYHVSLLLVWRHREHSCSHGDHRTGKPNIQVWILLKSLGRQTLRFVFCTITT